MSAVKYKSYAPGEFVHQWNISHNVTWNNVLHTLIFTSSKFIGIESKDRRHTQCLSSSSSRVSCVPGVFLHIQQLKVTILRTPETGVVHYLFITFSCSLTKLFVEPRGFLGCTKLKNDSLCSPCLHLSPPLSVCHCLPVSVCLPVTLSEKGTHPRLSGLDLHGDLILTNPRTVVLQLRPSLLRQPVITDHWMEFCFIWAALIHICVCVL